MKGKTMSEMENFICEKFNDEEDKVKLTYLSRHYKKVAKSLEKMEIISPQDVTREKVAKLIEEKIQLVFGESKNHTQQDIKRINLYIDFVNIVFGFNISPKETSLYSYKAVCPKCGKEMKYIETDKFSRYVCDSCNLSQSVLKGSNFPSGSPANKKVRELRKRVFSALNSLFPNNSNKKYPFIARVVGKKNDRMDNIIAYLDETECNHVLNAINFINAKKKQLAEIKNSKPLSYKMATYFFAEKAGIEELRWLWLVENKIRNKMENGLVFYKLDEIAKLMKTTPNEAIHNLWNIYGYGAPMVMNVKFMDSVINDYKGLFDSFEYDTIENFCTNLVRKGYFQNYKPQELFKVLARYNRIKLAIKFRDMSMEDFDKKYSF